MGSLLTLCWFREIQKSSSGLIRDYSLDPATFKLLVTNFGEFTTDALSTVPNAVCAKSYSRYFSSGSSGNFFAQGLSSREFW